MSTSEPTIAKLLEVEFQGYFMCRIATDPDPTNEQRGVSGYTIALVTEAPLDQVIRTQIDDPEFLERNLREPAGLMNIRIGVDVNNVLFDGKPYFGPARDALIGAKVYLEGKDEPFAGPIFDSRNNLVGSDDNMAFVVNPFEMSIRKKAEDGTDRLILRAVDVLNPARPEQKIWQIQDPSVYARRLPSFNGSSTQAQAAVRAFDGHEYFTDRSSFLRSRIRELEELKAAADGAERVAIETRIQTLRSRLYQLDFWGGRFETKLAFQVTYAFDINGLQSVEDRDNLLGGRVDCAHSWPVTFWFGSWDGDLLVGWMQGSLCVPFQPAA
jgi:hypothetical protein